MRKIYMLVCLIGYSIAIHAQAQPTDTIVPAKGNIKGQLKEIKKEKVDKLSDSAANDPKKTPLIDSTKYNKYGDLLNDDPKYNLKYPLWKPAVEVVGENVVLNIVDRTVMHLEFAKTDFTTWGRTTKAGFPWTNGWEWDQDRFGNNFLSHPMMGSFYYNAARTNGYNFWESAPIVLAGSYMWKIFGENGTPEREDLLNTTFDGILLGEVLYRLSSNILDDRTTGRERVLREVVAGLINPIRGFNRLLQGKCFRRTNTEVYQKEPLNITFYAGLHSVNNNQNAILSGKDDEMFNVQLDYGNPFELRKRKPFDYFRARAELNFGVGRKVVDNITGYGILFGKNVQWGKLSMLVGGFQYYDYFDTRSLELSTIALGGGIISKLPLGKNSNFYTNLHLAIVPFAGSSVGAVTDTSFYRDYRFAYGFEGKIESTLDLGTFASFTMVYYYYLIHAFDNTGKDESKIGTLGNNYINILKPRVTLQLYKNISIGLEHNIYINDHYQKYFPSLHETQTEQRIFLMIYLEDSQRKGQYH
jgi:Domain of unknown function (DUF3943)